MYSLAVLVAFLIFSCALSGPVALLLSSKKLQKVTERIALKIIRRLLMAIINFLGIIVSTFFMTAPTPLVLKAIALASFLLNIFAIDREYGSKISAYLRTLLRRGSNGPAGQS